MELVEIVTLAFSSSISLAALYITLRRNKRLSTREEAQTDVDLSKAAVQLLQPYKEEVASLRAQVADLSTQVKQLSAEVVQTRRQLADVTSGSWLLFQQVKSLEEQPVWTPPQRRNEINGDRSSLSS